MVDTQATRGMTVEQKIAYYSEPLESGCVRWTGKLPKGRYPRLTLNNVQVRVNRIVLERKLGRPLREDYCALHTCDNTWCVAEQHLYEGTKKDNADDAIQRGRFTYVPVYQGEQVPAATLTVEQVLAIRNAAGTCKEIGSRYGIGPMQVSRIKRRTSWGHLP